MKKFLLAIGCLTVFANAGIFTSIQSAGDPKITPKAFQLDTYGWNVRGYVFTVPSDSNKECVVLFTESEYKAPVMQCYDKKYQN